MMKKLLFAALVLSFTTSYALAAGQGRTPEEAQKTLKRELGIEIPKATTPNKDAREKAVQKGYVERNPLPMVYDKKTKQYYSTPEYVALLKYRTKKDGSAAAKEELSTIWRTLVKNNVANNRGAFTKNKYQKEYERAYTDFVEQEKNRTPTPQERIAEIKQQMPDLEKTKQKAEKKAKDKSDNAAKVTGSTDR